MPPREQVASAPSQLELTSEELGKLRERAHELRTGAQEHYKAGRGDLALQELTLATTLEGILYKHSIAHIPVQQTEQVPRIPQDSIPDWKQQQSTVKKQRDYYSKKGLKRMPDSSQLSLMFG